MARTLAQKIWDKHVVRSAPPEPDLLFVDLHLVHEVTSPQAFEGLRLAGRRVRRPDLTVATMDHNTPTRGGRRAADEVSGRQMDALEENCRRAGVRLYGMGRRPQGSVHVIGAERGPQCLPQSRPRDLAVTVEGELPFGVVAKDLVLGLVSRVGVAGGQGCAVGDRGSPIGALSMEGRMTICNMSIEWGARVGMVAPDDTTFAYLEGRPYAPGGTEWEH